MSVFEYYAYRGVGSYPNSLGTSEFIMFGEANKEWKMEVTKNLEDADIHTVRDIADAVNEETELLDGRHKYTKAILIDQSTSNKRKAKTDQSVQARTVHYNNECSKDH